MVKTNIEVLLKFVAKNPPSILILAGIVGWILCGFTKITVFCAWWLPLVLIGTALQVLWLAYKYKKI